MTILDASKKWLYKIDDLFVPRLLLLPHPFLPKISGAVRSTNTNASLGGDGSIRDLKMFGKNGSTNSQKNVVTSQTKCP